MLLSPRKLGTSREINVERVPRTLFAADCRPTGTTFAGWCPSFGQPVTASGAQTPNVPEKLITASAEKGEDRAAPGVMADVPCTIGTSRPLPCQFCTAPRVDFSAAAGVLKSVCLGAGWHVGFWRRSSLGGKVSMRVQLRSLAPGERCDFAACRNYGLGRSQPRRAQVSCRPAADRFFSSIASQRRLRTFGLSRLLFGARHRPGTGKNHSFNARQVSPV